jgi:hypothetical protein
MKDDHKIKHTKTFKTKVYEDFNSKYMRISNMMYTRTPIFSFQSNEASALEHIAPINFSVYSVELELDVRMCLNHTPILGFTRLDLSSLEAIEVFG